MHKFALVALTVTLTACGKRQDMTLYRLDDGGIGVRPYTGPEPPTDEEIKTRRRDDELARQARDAIESARATAVHIETREASELYAPHGPVVTHPLVTRCMKEEKKDWEHLLGCLTAVAPDVAAADAGASDAGHRLKGATPFPPSNNPSWQIPEWDYDFASRLATCSDSNTCVDSAHPCCTRQQVVSRWGTSEPYFRQNTVEKAHSSWPRSPVVDQFDVKVHVQNGAQYSFQCDLVQVATGTLASVVAKNRATPQRLNVTLASGLLQPTLVLDSSRNSYAWTQKNTAGTAWDMTEPLIENFVAPPTSPPSPDDGWVNGDNYTAYSELYIPLRHWAVSWEDLVDLPDSRPTLANCAVGQAPTAGQDNAMVRFDTMGDALLNVQFLNASSVVQIDYTHGSRAGTSVINPYGCSSGNVGVDACADGNAARITFAGNSIGGVTIDKQMQLYGGSVYVAFMANVELRADIDLEGLNLDGDNGYTDIYVGGANGLFAHNGSLVPDTSVSAAHVWGPGHLDPSDHETFVYLDPPCTNLLLTGSINTIDNSFTGSACDFTHAPGMCTPGLQVSTGIATVCNLLNTSVAAGGYGGTIYGPYGSVITDNLRRNDTTTPYFLFDGGIVGVGCGPGQSCTLTSNITSSTVSSGTGIVVTGGPNYTVSLSNPVAVVNGGTSDTSLTAHNVLLGEGTSAVAFAAPGTGGLPLVSNGASSDPVFSAITPAAINPGSSGQIISTCSSTSQWMTETGDVQFLSCSGTNRSNEILNLQGVSVTLASLTNGDVLTYNSTGPKWQNKPAPPKIYANTSGSTFTIGTSLSSCVTVTSVVVASGQQAYVTGMAWIVSTDGGTLHNVDLNITNVTNSGTGQVGQVDLGSPTGGPSGTNSDANLAGENIDNSVGTFTYATQLLRTGTLGTGTVTAHWCSIQAIVQ